ncbi:MAG: T9SS type A sorting domain-containing protein [Bacteroidota bacterium]
MKKGLTFLLVLSLLIPLMAANTYSQQPELKKQVIGNGGMVGLTNQDGDKLSGTIGQTNIGVISTSSLYAGKELDLYQGFWTPLLFDPISVNEPNVPETELANYPNPFNRSTTFKFDLPVGGQVSLKVFDMNGQVVSTPVENRFMSAGYNEVPFEAKNEAGTDLASGTYIYELTVRASAGISSSGFDTYTIRNTMVIVR